MAKKIFLVDDELISNKINKKMLQMVDPTSEYIDYTDPREAYSAISAQHPDLIFLDLNMPFMSGWDFLDKMTAEGLATSVVILTSSISHADQDKAGTYSNVLEFMNKPVNKALLGKYLA